MARPRHFDEAEVVRAARDAFWKNGYAGTSMDDLMTATGLGKGSLYGAFGDKHALFLRVFGDICEGTVRVVREYLDGPDAGAFGRIEEYFADPVEAIVSDRKHRGCMLGKGTSELAGTDPEVLARARQTFNALHATFAACVAQAQREGTVDPKADASALGGLLLAVARGMDAVGKGGMDAAALEAMAKAAIASLPRPPKARPLKARR